jgi:hypothetical protein
MRNFNPIFSHVINYISNLPFLYRYENENHIDDFFKNGNLLISSFQNYKKYNDNELGDINEGNSLNIANGENDKTIFCSSNVGKNDYTFCTSTILDRKHFLKFSRNSVFRITDPMNFIIEITRSIPRPYNVLHGNCIYVNERILTKKYKNINMQMLENSEEQIMMEKMMHINQDVQKFDAYFLKKRKYQEQSEYRIIWQTDREVNQGIIINCPEATKYCERINHDEF